MTSILLLLSGTVSPALAADILYCRDFRLSTDYLSAALTASGHTVTTTTDLAGTCESEIATGGYDLVVAAVQNSSFSLPNLNAWMEAGNPTIYQDPRATEVSVLGASRKDTNLSVVSNLDPVLSTGVSGSTLGLNNPGWSVFSYSMEPSAGLASLANFEDGNSAIVLVGTSVFINGFLIDTADASSGADMEQLYLNEINFSLTGGVDADDDGSLDAAYGGTDCDDTDAGVHPGAAETYYDGTDANCDGASDFDADMDGYDSDAFGGADCDDADGTVNPGATEIYYDGADQDCDGGSDFDNDGDGYDSDAFGGDDCNDDEATIHPGKAEIWYTGADEACDGGSDYDQDGDGYDSDAFGGDDCDDADASVNPDGTEVYYDGTDQDCDGASDYDKDLDGFDSDAYGGSDCDDGDSAINPDATEVIDGGVDNDCNGFDETWDQDGDGLTDVLELSIGTRPDDDDSDDDGMTDGEEVDESTDPLDKDTDDDGLSDGAEYNVYFCNPLVQDTDADGLGDAMEVGRDYDTIDTVPGYFVPDADRSTTTDPNDADTDDDGLGDGVEDDNQNGAQEAGETDAASFDSDGDLVSDGTELGVASATLLDTDLSEFVADSDPSTTTNPFVADTDGGGVTEGGEDFNVDGRVDSGECDPNDASDDSDCVDTDGDGLPDAAETELGTDPNDADSDNDLLNDGVEVILSGTDPNNYDTDGDGLTDGEEDADLDGTRDTNETDPNNPDSDNGGVNDGTEVKTDGTNPLDGTDDLVPADTDDTGGADTGDSGSTELKYVYAGRGGCDAAGGAPAAMAIGAALTALAARRRK